MGVKRLKQYLLENNHTTKTYLKDAADTWRSCGGNSVLVVDTLNILNHVANYSETHCCGGEYPAIEANFVEIIQAFKDIDIELVFFIDGTVLETRLDMWKKHQIEKMISHQDEFEKIEIRKVGDFAESELFAFLAPTVAKETVKAHCKIVETLGDPDLAMVEYVMENKCLGIISEDTDFLVFDGIPHVFLPKDVADNICHWIGTNGKELDPKCIKVTEYLRTNFIQSIGLESEAFPIFATLAGNDCIEFSQSTDYLRRKFGVPYLQKIAGKLADVANDIYRRSEGNVETAALYLAKEIYQNSDYNKSKMLDSLRSYDWRNTDIVTPPPFNSTNDKWNDCVERLLKTSNRLPHESLCIAVNQCYIQCDRFEDKRKPCGVILSDFRRRIYSVLLHEKSDGTEYVEEYVANSPQSFVNRYLVGTVKVEVDHPGLWTLFNGGEEFDDIRWKIVWWVMCPAEVVPYDKFKNFRNLPDELKLVGLTVFYLYGVVKEITKHEASMIMLMASTVSVYSRDELKEFSMVRERTTKRAVSVATLYLSTYDYVRWTTLDVSGLKVDCKTSKCYSGHLFHWLLRFEDITQLKGSLLPQVWNKFFLLDKTLEESL